MNTNTPIAIDEEAVRAAFRAADEASPMRDKSRWQIWRDAAAWALAFTPQHEVEPVGAASEEDAFVIQRLADVLAGTAIALKGDEAPLHRHSYHDLPEIAATLRLELDLYRATFPNGVPASVIDAMGATQATTQAEPPILLQDSTLYVLNARGTNRWWASVQPGQDDDGKRISDEECRAIARQLAARDAHTPPSVPADSQRKEAGS